MIRAREIEIVGGGLGGLALGLALRSKGVPVTLHEAGDYPRHRVCGEFIAGLSEATIEALGLAPFVADALRHEKIGWFSGEQPILSQRLPSPALGISRHRLDARLARAFTEAGGVLHTHSRAGLEPKPGRVIAAGRMRAPSPWIGLKVHCLNLKTAQDLEVHLGKNAYVGLSKVEDGRTNLCGLFRRRPISGRRSSVLNGYLVASGLGALAERLQAAELDEASFCAVAALNFSAPRPQGGIRIGDAFAAIAPFTGNGMAMAFQGAEAALEPVLAYARDQLSWKQSSDAANRSLGRIFRLRMRSSVALHPYFLEPSRQRWLVALGRSGLLPLRPLYGLLH